MKKLEVSSESTSKDIFSDLLRARSILDQDFYDSELESSLFSLSSSLSHDLPRAHSLYSKNNSGKTAG